MNTTFPKLLVSLAFTAALAACGGGDAEPATQTPAAAAAADPLDDQAADAAPNQMVPPPGDPFDEADVPAAAQVPDAVS